MTTKRRVILEIVEAGWDQTTIDYDVQYRVENVQIDFLGHQTDAGFCRLNICVDIVPKYRDLTGGLVDQRTDNADHRRLARTVGSEQGIEVARLDLEIDALHRLYSVAVGLGQLFS